MEQTQPLVSVIIPHHTGRSLLQRCLKSVAASRGIDVQTIVVTSDATYTDDAGIDLYYFNDGPAAKRNLGVLHAVAETIVFLDDDVEISPFCLYELWKFLEEHPLCGMAFAKIYKMEEGRRKELDDCGSWLTWTGFLYARAGNHQVDNGQYNQPQRCLASKSATCVVRRHVWRDVGGFNAAYYILGEETDLAWRIWLRGGEVWYCPTAVSWHAFGCESLKPRTDFYTIQRTMTYGCRNYLWLLTTNLGLVSWVRTFPWHVLAWTLATVGFLTRGDTPRAKAILRGFWLYLSTLPQTFQTRQRVQSRRQVNDAALWPLISYRPPLSYYWQRMSRYWTTQLHG